MASVSFTDLWKNHPYPDTPCDTSLFANQCAIRMGVALQKSGVSTKSFSGATCAHFPALKHKVAHILRAQELANWLKAEGQKSLVGKVKIYTKKVSSEDFVGKNGIVFIKDGWGATDHIDVWSGTAMALKGGSPDYFMLGKQVWFWQLT